MNAADTLTLFQSATLDAATRYCRATLATDSFLPARTVLRTTSGCWLRDNCPFSATCTATSSTTVARRGTSRVEPAWINMPLGMALIALKSASLMPTRLAASAGLSAEGACQAVQLANWAPE